MKSYQQARRPGVIRIPGWWTGLALMVVSAALVAGAIYLAFVVLTSLHGYVPSQLR